jgi:RNA polymerase sigma-70 factor (ECF subfamily)
VTQEAFLAVWHDAGRFDPRRGSGRSWVLALAHHKAIDVLRRARLRATEPLGEALEDPSGDAAGQALEAVERARVRQALAGLAASQREAIALAYFGGCTQQEIARRLGVPLGTVKSRIRDGMLRLRTHLGDEPVEGGR